MNDIIVKYNNCKITNKHNALTFNAFNNIENIIYISLPINITSFQLIKSDDINNIKIIYDNLLDIQNININNSIVNIISNNFYIFCLNVSEKSTIDIILNPLISYNYILNTLTSQNIEFIKNIKFYNLIIKNNNYNIKINKNVIMLKPLKLKNNILYFKLPNILTSLKINKTNDINNLKIYYNNFNDILVVDNNENTFDFSIKKFFIVCSNITNKSLITITLDKLLYNYIVEGITSRYFKKINYDLPIVKNNKFKNNELINNIIEDDKLKNNKLKNDKLKDDKLKNDKLKDDELKDDEFKDEKLRDNKLKNEKLRDNKLKNEKTKKNNYDIVIVIPIITKPSKQLLETIKNIKKYFILLNINNDDKIEQYLSKIKYNNVKSIQCLNCNYSLIINDVLQLIDDENKWILFLNQNQKYSNELLNLKINFLIDNPTYVISLGGYVLLNGHNIYGVHVSNETVLFNYLSFNGLLIDKNILLKVKLDNKINLFHGIEYNLSKQLLELNYNLKIINNGIDVVEFVNPTNIIKNEININSKYLIHKWKLNYKFHPYDYINIVNFNKLPSKHLIDETKYNINNHIENNIIELKSNKKICVCLADFGYPPFGGGENWLIDIMYFLTKQNYQTIFISFRDLKTQSYDKLRIFNDNENIKYIQHPPVDHILIKTLKYLNPHCIINQGTNRILYMSISNVLNIPFISGLCFWHDVIKLMPNFNKDMLESELIADEKFNYINENTDYLYSSSKFVNDVIQKVHNIKLDVIDTISNDKHYYITKNDFCNNIYISCINIHPLKNGWIIKSLIENLNVDIPLLLIQTENSIYDDELFNLLEQRNLKTNIKSIIIKEKIDNIKDIYKKTKILLVGSIVDETFCRVAYEGMKNKIPILSTDCGNLRYLLKGYSTILSKTNENEWHEEINKIYFDENKLNEMSNRIPTENLTQKDIEEKICDIVNNIKLKNKFIPNKNNVGILIPWTNQGLGIQGREYYLELTKKNYNVHIMAFKPYIDNLITDDNNFEWDYPNVHYYNHTREQLTPLDILDFIKKTKIHSMIFIELCYKSIFNTVAFFKSLNVNCIGIPNIETLRYDELIYHSIFDVILCNNYMTYDLLKHAKLTNIDYLGFKINHPYFNNKKTINNDKIIRFCAFGGLNSIIRKHIKKICDVFDELKFEKTNNHLI